MISSGDTGRISFLTEIRSAGTGEITYDKFIDMVDKDQVKEVVLQSGVLTVEPKLRDSFESDIIVNQMENTTHSTKKRLEGKDIIFSTQQPDVW